METREVRGMGKMNKISSKNNIVEALDGFNEIPVSDEGFTMFPDSGGIAGLEMDENLCSAEMGLVYSPFFHQKASEMLSFQGNNDRKSETANKCGISGSDTSSTSSSNNSLPISLRTESQQKRRVKHDYGSVSGAGPGSVAGSLENCSVDSGKTLKKPKGETTPASSGPLKVRKEKLGERILALQQLVSPFGKTDTASVLHEAMEYIRFLQDQVQVLSSPYLKRIPSPLSMEGGQEETNNDLRSRGLCLAPVACTLHVAKSNGADFWSPAMGSSTSKH